MDHISKITVTLGDFASDDTLRVLVPTVKARACNAMGFAEVSVETARHRVGEDRDCIVLTLEASHPWTGPEELSLDDYLDEMSDGDNWG